MMRPFLPLVGRKNARSQCACRLVWDRLPVALQDRILARGIALHILARRERFCDQAGVSGEPGDYANTNGLYARSVRTIYLRPDLGASTCGVFAHELGHALDHVLGVKGGRVVTRLFASDQASRTWRERVGRAGPEALGAYAPTNGAEYFAEGVRVVLGFGDGGPLLYRAERACFAHFDPATETVLARLFEGDGVWEGLPAD